MAPLFARAQWFLSVGSHVIIQPSTDSAGILSTPLWSYNACAFGIIRSKHHISLQHKNRRTKRLDKQIACLRASLIGKVRNLLKYLFLIPLAKILTCKNPKCIAFCVKWCPKQQAACFTCRSSVLHFCKAVKRVTLLEPRVHTPWDTLKKVPFEMQQVSKLLLSSTPHNNV